MTTPFDPQAPYALPLYVDGTQAIFQIEPSSRQLDKPTPTGRHYLPRGSYMAYVSWAGPSGVKINVRDGVDDPIRSYTLLPEDRTKPEEQQRTSGAVNFVITPDEGAYITLRRAPITPPDEEGGHKMVAHIIPMPLYEA